MTRPEFAAGQVLTIFRSRLGGAPSRDYDALDRTLRERAQSLGGLVDVKSFTADDGERVTLVTFEDRDAHERWAADAMHVRAQDLGRSSLYGAYSVQVGECTKVSVFPRPPA